MTNQELIDEVKLELTGDYIETELSDDTFNKIVSKSIREVQRYYDEETQITIPFASCIDLKGSEFYERVSSIVGVYRTDGVSSGDGESYGCMTDPIYMQQYALWSNGGLMYNLSDYAANYGAWMTLMKIKNTMSTDMAYTEDRHNQKLYINNTSSQACGYVTILYIPKISEADDIVSDYWVDVLVRMTVAHAKVELGRIRTRYKASNSLWEGDGQTILDEGKAELEKLRDRLNDNANLIYPID